MIHLFKYNLILFLFAFYGNSIASGFNAVQATNGMVVSAEAHASDIGIEVLKSGGNAVDAAVAVAFTLAVTYPNAGNLGGGGFLLYRDPQKQVYALDYREKAPRKALKDMYLDGQGAVLPGKSILGYQAVGVPGSVAGLWQAHQRFGKLPWADLILPAIKLAKEGFEPDRFQQEKLTLALADFNLDPAAQAIYTRDGKPFSLGERLIQSDLALTLSRIAQKGRDGFYGGLTADLIQKSMAENNGLIDKEDLNTYHAIWREPLQGNYRGYQIYSMPPSSSGGIILYEILNTLELFPIPQMDPMSSALIQLWVEVERRAYEDRSKYLGDPDFVSMPVEQLISKEYARKIKKNLNLNGAGKSDVHLMWSGKAESDQTTHFSIVDQWGGAVSNTTTLNGNFGARVVVAGTGVLLNNEMDDFSMKPGYPNSYGLVGSKANAIAPGKRMLSSMTPTIVTRNDSLFMLIGGPGGSKIITTVAQVISNVVDHQLNIREAIELGRFHHQWLPDSVYLEENRFSLDTRKVLQNMGYKLGYRTYMGFAQGILVDPNFNQLSGWSDPRSDGKVSGY